MSRNRIPKEVAQRKHLQKRAWQRFGIHVGEQWIDEVIARIQAGKLGSGRKQTNRVTIFRTELDGNPVQIAYDKSRKELATIMPGDWEVDTK